jgi:divalent metal cation (Fe/Co/Zn/Cd) transporter
MISKAYARAIGLIVVLFAGGLAIYDIIMLKSDPQGLQPTSHIVVSLISAVIAGTLFQYADNKGREEK